MTIRRSLRKLASRLGYELIRGPNGDVSGVRKIPRDRRDIHFIHLSKNAGTQIGAVAAQVNSKCPSVRIIKHHHNVKLIDLPPEGGYFFSIRDPIQRFVSGFYSRKRKGQPRIFSEWTEHEQIAFADFEHAVDLAEALFEAGDFGARAFSAIRSIRHNARNQVDWFIKTGDFLRTRPPIWIIRQEKFKEDLTMFLRRSEIEIEVEIEKDAVKAHRNDYHGVPELSPKAVSNLTTWYAQDFELYRICEEWINSNALALS